MFRSQLSGRQYLVREKPVLVVVERRARTYVNEKGFVSQGWEIARELRVGPDEVLKAVA